jgi:hypothetical protein
MLTAFISLLNVLLAVQVAQAPSAALCSPRINVPAGSRDLWDVGNKRIKSGQYAAGARAYYQFVVCNANGWVAIPSAVVEDYDQLKPYEAALSDGANGNFVSAIKRLNNIVRVLPEFGDARFLSGVFQWSAGMHAQARATWRKVLTEPNFVTPPGPRETPRPVIDAKAFLLWSASKNVSR